MVSATATGAPPAAGPTVRSLRALDGLNFFVAAAMAGFGPFVAVFLGNQGWSEKDIGFVLSAGGIAGLVTQLPGGELLDLVRSKRLFVAGGLVMVAAGALIIAIRPDHALVLTALVLQGATGAVLGPAVAAISLGLVGHTALAEQLGRNQCFKSVGSLAAAGLVGAIGYFFSNRMIFVATAVLALPALGSLLAMHAPDIHFGRSIGAPEHHERKRPPRAKRRSFWKNRRLLILAGCLFLFQLADASILPLLGGGLAQRAGDRSSLIMSALVIVPQIIVALLAPWAGHRAQSWGRRPLLLIGFGVLPVRALVFAATADPMILGCAQLLDGVSGTVITILTPVIIADLTTGTGRFNLAQGLVGTSASVGAALSTTLSGLLAVRFGAWSGFAAGAGVALAATFILWAFMPETKPAPE